MGDVQTKDEYLAGRLATRANEIHVELTRELKAAGEDPLGPPEWDEYRDRRADPYFGGPSPAYQEAWRRASAEFPSQRAAVERLGDE